MENEELHRRFFFLQVDVRFLQRDKN